MIPSSDSSGQPLLLSLSFLPNAPLANSSLPMRQPQGLGEGVILSTWHFCHGHIIYVGSSGIGTPACFGSNMNLFCCLVSKQPI